MHRILAYLIVIILLLKGCGSVDKSGVAQAYMDKHGFNATYVREVEGVSCDRRQDHGWYLFSVHSETGDTRALVCVIEKDLVVVDWLYHEWDELP